MKISFETNRMYDRNAAFGNGRGVAGVVAKHVQQEVQQFPFLQTDRSGKAAMDGVLQRLDEEIAPFVALIEEKIRGGLEALRRADENVQKAAKEFKDRELARTKALLAAREQDVADAQAKNLTGEPLDNMFHGIHSIQEGIAVNERNDELKYLQITTVTGCTDEKYKKAVEQALKELN